MSTWPPGVVTPYGADVFTDGVIPNIWITSADGNQQFRIMGGLAPFPGVTDGIICTEHPKGLSPNFKHLDVQAARQDGVTYQGTVYEPAKITFKLQVHARNARVLSRIMDEWMGAWNPRVPCVGEFITPDGSAWIAQLRLMPDSWGDAFKLTPRLNGVWDMTHICRIDDAFWTGPTTTGTWAPTYTDFGDDFSTNTTSGLGAGWLTTYTPGATGFEYVKDGEVHWTDRKNNSQSVLNTYTAQATEIDNQVVSVTLGGSWGGVQMQGDATTVIGGRMDTNGNGVFVRLEWDFIEFYALHAGGTSIMYTAVLDTPPKPYEIWQLVCGAQPGNPRTYAVTRSGMTIFNFTEVGTFSLIGASNRFAGFGMSSAEGVFTEQKPLPIANFSVADNTPSTQSGYVELVNVGTEVAWPTIKFTGPGVLSIGNGPNSTSMITFPNLVYGQTILMETLPRYQRVLDITNGATDNTTNDTTLQAEITGVFNNPIPGVATPDLADLVQIPVTVTGGTATSILTLSVKPRRVHPA